MLELPRGTVTFLFTDIEGSTALWERDQHAMAAAVSRHLTLLDAAIAAHGGAHYKTVGDAVQAAFPTAPQAVAAALDGQRALLGEEWGEGRALRVRMALHAGEAAPDKQGDYLVPALNRLSRLLSTGYGGQILISQTVHQLARGALPAGADVRDLGEHRLRDLLEPERIFQFLHPDLPDPFPPLKTLASQPNNLPLQPTPFLGREQELAQVVALVQRPDVRFLTLTGPGGTGKSRLALQAAAELLDDFADGVYFVPLAALADSDLVLATVAMTLGMREEGGQPVGQRLRAFLADKQVLLVLDNLEHLVHAAPAVGELLATAPRLMIMTTSRTPLRLRAEWEYAVPPLGLPRRKPPPPPEQLSQFEAVRLFIQRAQAVKADFTIDNASAPAVAEICWCLDGLPLAIELAAARVRMLPPAAMLTRLGHRLPLLTGGARDAPERQRTLRNTIAWSYDLLEPGDQTVFRRLAVFTGGATVEAAETVADPEGQLDIFGSLERLLEQSLLRQDVGLDGEPRFTMLETIREFGLELLAADGEGDAVRQRHAAFYLDLVEQAEPALIGPGQVTWLDRLETEHGNLRAVLGWALERDVETALRLAPGLRRFWLRRGHLGEGRAWLDRILEASGEPGPLHVEALLGAVSFSRHFGDLQRADTANETALQIARHSQDRRAEALALIDLGMVAGHQGDVARWSELTERSLALWRELGETWGTALALNNLGYAAYLQGDFARAAVLLDEALVLAREAGDRVLVGSTLDSLGALAEAQEALGRAASLYREALVVAQEMGNPITVGLALHALAAIAIKAHQPARAARLWGAVAALEAAIGVRLPMEEQERVDDTMEGTIAAVREHLGEEAYRAALEGGRALARDAAVSEALVLADAIVHDANGCGRPLAGSEPSPPAGPGPAGPSGVDASTSSLAR